MNNKSQQTKTAQEPTQTEELYSLSRLAEYFDMDRGALRRRLHQANVQPAQERANHKLYRLEEVEAVIEPEEKNAEFEAAKLRKLSAEASLRELELEREREEVLPRKDVEDYAFKLFSGLFQRLAVRLPREIAPQLWKAESQSQMTTQLETSISAIFNELRNDHQRFLGTSGTPDEVTFKKRS